MVNTMYVMSPKLYVVAENLADSSNIPRVGFDATWRYGRGSVILVPDQSSDQYQLNLVSDR